jgi:hypothetical protein
VTVKVIDLFERIDGQQGGHSNCFPFVTSARTMSHQTKCAQSCPPPDHIFLRCQLKENRIKWKLGLLTSPARSHSFPSLRSNEIIEAIGANKIIFYFKKIKEMCAFRAQSYDDFMLLKTTIEPQQPTLSFTDLMNGRPRIMKRLMKAESAQLEKSFK